MERAKSVDLTTSSKNARSFIERSSFMKALLKVVGVAGVSLVMSGILTQSWRLYLSELTNFLQTVSWHLRSRSSELFKGIYPRPKLELPLILPSLSIVKDDITSSTIVGTTCAILVLLFLIQPFGTTKIAMFFAPIVILWLLLNLSFGIFVIPPVFLGPWLLV